MLLVVWRGVTGRGDVPLRGEMEWKVQVDVCKSKVVYVLVCVLGVSAFEYVRLCTSVFMSVCIHLII